MGVTSLSWLAGVVASSFFFVSACVASSRYLRRAPFRLLGQWSAGLLRAHVRGVPLRPTIVAMPQAFLVFAVGRLSTPKRVGQIGCRREGCRRGIDAARQPRHDLLKQPAVPIRIAERGERPIAATYGIRSFHADSPEQIWLVRPGVHVVPAMEYFADRNAAPQQVFARSLDVSNDQIKTLN